MKSVKKKLKDRGMADERMFQKTWEERDSIAHRRRATSKVGGKVWRLEISFLVQGQEAEFPPGSPCALCWGRGGRLLKVSWEWGPGSAGEGRVTLWK